MSEKYRKVCGKNGIIGISLNTDNTLEISVRSVVDDTNMKHPTIEKLLTLAHLNQTAVKGNWFINPVVDIEIPPDKLASVLKNSEFQDLVGKGMAWELLQACNPNYPSPGRTI